MHLIKRASKYIKQNLIEMQGGIHKSTPATDFNTLPEEQPSRQKNQLMCAQPEHSQTA